MINAKTIILAFFEECIRNTILLWNLKDVNIIMHEHDKLIQDNLEKVE